MLRLVQRMASALIVRNRTPVRQGARHIYRSPGFDLLRARVLHAV